MSSPTESSTSRTPATGTKRRYLGAARRKRAPETVLFSPTSKQLQQPHVQQQAKPIHVCTEEGQCSENKEQNNLVQVESANTRKRTCEQLIETNSLTPAQRTQNKRALTSTPGGKMQISEVDKDRNEMAKSSNSSSSSTSLHSTPTHRLPTRHLLSGLARKRLKHENFKSPVRIQTVSSKPTESVENLRIEVEKLQQTAQDLQAEIASLTNEGYCEEELQTHIEKMHEYNELKDTGQMLLGKIAMVQGVTTKDLYERFGLNLDD